MAAHTPVSTHHNPHSYPLKLPYCTLPPQPHKSPKAKPLPTSAATSAWPKATSSGLRTDSETCLTLDSGSWGVAASTLKAHLTLTAGKAGLGPADGVAAEWGAAAGNGTSSSQECRADVPQHAACDPVLALPLGTQSLAQQPDLGRRDAGGVLQAAPAPPQPPNPRPELEQAIKEAQQELGNDAVQITAELGTCCCLCVRKSGEGGGGPVSRSGAFH